MVMIAVSEKKDITVALQPSLKGHPTFTDFLIWIRNRNDDVRFIEVKRTDIGVEGSPNR